LPRGHGRSQIADGLRLVDGLRLDRIRIQCGLARVAERCVYRVRQRMHHGWLTFPGDNNARAAMRGEVRPHRSQPRLGVAGKWSALIDARNANIGCQRSRK
jgi:hypothetical protein